MENSEIIGWSCLVFYILGFIVHFRMFMKEEFEQQKQEVINRLL